MTQATNSERIAAVVLAAGLSTRMGSPKMALPWGKSTIIGQVVGVLLQAGVAEIVVVTGGARQQVQEALQGQAVRIVFNPGYADGEMLRSLQVGLQALPEDVEAALVVLGDQPQIEAGVVRAVATARPTGAGRLVIPSFHMKRGHPWRLPRALWEEVLALRPPHTLRDLLNRHTAAIDYLEVDTPSILQDLDTPEQYRQQKPE